MIDLHRDTVLEKCYEMKGNARNLWMKDFHHLVISTIHSLNISEASFLKRLVKIFYSFPINYHKSIQLCTNSFAKIIYTEFQLYVRSRKHDQRYSPSSQRQGCWGQLKFESYLGRQPKTSIFTSYPKRLGSSRTGHELEIHSFLQHIQVIP